MSASWRRLQRCRLSVSDTLACPAMPGLRVRALSCSEDSSLAYVLCISRKVQQKVQAGCPEAYTIVVYNGVDSQLFRPDSAKADSSTILCVGNLIPTKGQELLIRAFAEVRKAVPQAVLRFIGTGA